MGLRQQKIVTPFLVPFYDESENEKQSYMDYEALINSDDEWLCLESMANCDWDSLITDEVYYVAP